MSTNKYNNLTPNQESARIKSQAIQCLNHFVNRCSKQQRMKMREIQSICGFDVRVAGSRSITELNKAIRLLCTALCIMWPTAANE